MASERQLPRSVEEVWKFTKDKFEAGDAAHLDGILVQIGNDVVATSKSRPRDASSGDQMVWDAWKDASPREQQRLAELFMRSVGHREFLDQEND